MKRFMLRLSCVESDEKSITEMVDQAREITYRTMCKNCLGLIAWAESVGYFRYKNKGITLATDSRVTFHRSRYQGKACYYLVWSAIEYIWLKVER